MESLTQRPAFPPGLALPEAPMCLRCLWMRKLANRVASTRAPQGSIIDLQVGGGCRLQLATSLGPTLCLRCSWMGKVATGAASMRTSHSLRPMKSRASMCRPHRLNFRSDMDASSSVKKLRCAFGCSGCT